MEAKQFKLAALVVPHEKFSMNSMFRGWMLIAGVACGLSGHTRLWAEDVTPNQEISRKPDASYTEVEASARYLRMDAISSKAKSEAGFNWDEATLRAGKVMKRHRAEALLAELATLTKQTVRSTAVINLSLGRPASAGIGNAEDVTGLPETRRMISGESILPKPEVMTLLYVFPVEAKDWTLHLEVELTVTTLERFVPYASESEAGLEPGSLQKLVKTPTGFYKPVFATETTKADVRVVSGDVVLLLSANGERLYFLTATARPVKR